MFSSFTLGKKLSPLVCAAALLAPAAQATIVQVQTNLGNFEINLFDHDPTVKPTVDNFLGYVTGAEGYEIFQDVVVHRVEKNFVIQTGGQRFNNETGLLSRIKQTTQITNAPVFSNVEMTVAMAKVSGYPNSATNQWFINLKDNSTLLDPDNGGFTVFGKVTGGEDVVRQIATLDIFRMGTELTQLPLLNYTVQDSQNKVPVERENFVIIENILVVDSSTTTAASLNPAKNTLITEVAKDKEKSNKASGAFGFVFLGLMGVLFGMGRKRRQ